MTDTSSTGAADAAPASTLTAAPKDSSAQMIVAAATVAGIVAIAGGAILAAVLDRSIAPVAFTVVGTGIGALANSLNAPTGISAVLASARKTGDAQ